MGEWVLVYVGFTAPIYQVHFISNESRQEVLVKWREIQSSFGSRNLKFCVCSCFSLTRNKGDFVLQLLRGTGQYVTSYHRALRAL